MAHYFDDFLEKYVGEHLGVKYTLPVDNTPSNPREEIDNWLGTMACEHGRHKLGDADGTALLADAIRSSKYYRDSWEDEDSRFYKGDAREPAGISAMLPLCKDIIFLPLYLYDHSGITMSTGSFSCRWDSGQVGFIFVPRAEAYKVFGKKVTRDKIEKSLKAEVTIYDHYITGNVYGWEVGEESVWGYYGVEDAASSAEEHIDNLNPEEVAELIKLQEQD